MVRPLRTAIIGDTPAVGQNRMLVRSDVPRSDVQNIHHKYSSHILCVSVPSDNWAAVIETAIFIPLALESTEICCVELFFLVCFFSFPIERMCIVFTNAGHFFFYVFVITPKF